MTTTPGSAGGFASDSGVGELAEALRADSAIVATGATVYDNLQSVFAVPREAGKATAYWVAEGVPPPAESDPTLGLASVVQRTLIARTALPVQLLRQSSAELVIRRLLTRSVGEALDAAAISGTGGAQPLGIINTPGVAAASGTALSYATIAAQIEVLMLAGARAGDLFALAGPTAAKILSTRERATGSGFILDGGRIANVPCTVSANVPASALILGVAAQLAIASWGPGISVRTNESSGFNTASVDLRVSIDADVTVLQPAAFVVFATVT